MSGYTHLPEPLPSYCRRRAWHGDNCARTLLILSCFSTRRLLAEAGTISGWDDVRAEDGTPKLGGVVVGLLQPAAGAAKGSGQDADRLWLAAVITARGIDAFASKAEVEGIIDQLHTLVDTALPAPAGESSTSSNAEVDKEPANKASP